MAADGAPGRGSAPTHLPPRLMADRKRKRSLRARRKCGCGSQWAAPRERPNRTHGAGSASRPLHLARSKDGASLKGPHTPNERGPGRDARGERSPGPAPRLGRAAGHAGRATAAAAASPAPGGTSPGRTPPWWDGTDTRQGAVGDPAPLHITPHSRALNPPAKGLFGVPRTLLQLFKK